MEGGGDEAGEQGVRCEGAATQLWMKLDANEPGMIGTLAKFWEHAIGRETGKGHARRFNFLTISDVDFKAVAVALADQSRAIDVSNF